jgi:hypothetical protein
MAYNLPHPEAKPPTLKVEEVPEEFRQLIPLAEKYGVSDDFYRAFMLKSLDAAERAELKQFLIEFDDALDSWLAGPESNGPIFTDAYIVFSCLRIAEDEART